MADEIVHDMSEPLKPICEAWLQQIRIAQDVKKKAFGDDAKEAMCFFDGPTKELWSKYMRSVQSDESERLPRHLISTNRVFEAVKLLAPKLVPSNPHREVMARIPEQPQSVLAMFGDPAVDPLAAQMMMQHQQQTAMQDQLKRDAAQALEEYLNYTPRELDLLTQLRRAIEEAIIKGAGVVWTEMVRDKGVATRMVSSFFESIDYLVWDADATVFDDVNWIARECCRHHLDVEAEYGLPVNSLRGKGKLRSAEKQAADESNPKANAEHRQGRAGDMITYYKIYSKVGMGSRFVKEGADVDYEQFGDFVFLVVAPNIPYPLNLPPAKMKLAPEELTLDAAWPAPFWADGKWPCEVLRYHEKPGSTWPISHIKPGMGELKAINYLLSALVSKGLTAMNTLVGVAAAEKDKLSSLFRAKPIDGYTLIPVEAALASNNSVKDYITFLDPPAFNTSIWDLIAALTNAFEKRVGLTEIMYGSEGQNQVRVAADIQIRQQNAGSRIDDMYRITGNWLTAIARKEAIAARWLLDEQDLQPVLGPMATQVWAQALFPLDIEQMVREYDYRIEAGDAPELRKQAKIEHLTTLLQYAQQPLTMWTQMGQAEPLVNLIREIAKEIGVEQPERFVPDIQAMLQQQMMMQQQQMENERLAAENSGDQQPQAA